MGLGLQGAFGQTRLRDEMARLLADRQRQAFLTRQEAARAAQQQFENARVTSSDDLSRQLLARKLGLENVGLLEGTEPTPQTVDVPGVGGSPAIIGGEMGPTDLAPTAPARLMPMTVPGVPAAGVAPLRLRPRSAGELGRSAEQTRRTALEDFATKADITASTSAAYRQPPKSLDDLRNEAQARAEGTRAGGGGIGGGDAEIPGLPPGVTGPEVLAYLPRGEAATVRKLLDYKIQLPSGMALRTPEWRRILAAAAMADPDFDAAQYPTRLKTRTDFTTGKTARVINSLNTAVGHLGSLAKTAQSLDNMSVQVLNQVRNFGRAQTGDPRIVEFEIAANAVANELATVFKGTGATDQEIKAWRHTLSAAQSPEQLQGAINQAIDLLGSRLEALHNQYSQGMNTAEEYNMLSPKSRKVLEGLGINVDVFDPGQDYILAKPGTRRESASVDLVFDPATGAFKKPGGG